MRVCKRVPWRSHPGSTGLLITLSVTWHLLRRGDRASPVDTGKAALSLALLSPRTPAAVLLRAYWIPSTCMIDSAPELCFSRQAEQTNTHNARQRKAPQLANI